MNYYLRISPAGLGLPDKSYYHRLPEDPAVQVFFKKLILKELFKVIWDGRSVCQSVKASIIQVRLHKKYLNYKI